MENEKELEMLEKEAEMLEKEAETFKEQNKKEIQHLVKGVSDEIDTVIEAIVQLASGEGDEALISHTYLALSKLMATAAMMKMLVDKELAKDKLNVKEAFELYSPMCYLVEVTRDLPRVFYVAIADTKWAEAFGYVVEPFMQEFFSE